MMTTTSYLFALIIYWLSAALGCRLLYRMWFQRLSPRWAGAITGLCAGILLAPSYAATDTSTTISAVTNAARVHFPCLVLLHRYFQIACCHHCCLHVRHISLTCDSFF